MMDKDELRTILGIIGNIISLFLFLSPLPTIFEVWKAGSVRNFRPDPYIVTVINCAMWVFYGMPFVHPNNIPVITTNGAGLIIELIYVAVFFYFSNWPKRGKIIFYLIIELVLFICIVTISMKVFHTTDKRCILVGIVCTILTVAMYVAPLTVMCQVIATKSVKYMPFTLSLANLANGCIWVAYASIKFDLYILIPNGIGVLSGIGQLTLYAIYYGSTNWDEDDSTTDVEIPRSNIS